MYVPRTPITSCSCDIVGQVEVRICLDQRKFLEFYLDESFNHGLFFRDLNPIEAKDFTNVAVSS